MVVSPFNNIIQLDIYSNILFVPASKFFIRFNGTPSNSINWVAFQPHYDMPTDKYLFKDSSIYMPRIEKATTLL